MSYPEWYHYCHCVTVHVGTNLVDDHDLLNKWKDLRNPRPEVLNERP